MRWKDRRGSENIEDRRGRGGGRAVGGGIGILLLAVVVYFLGGDPSALLQPSSAPVATNSAPRSPEEDERARFVSVVLADTEEVWTKLFADQGQTYVKPRLVLFTDQVESACGTATSAVGPFYCGEDQQIYIDLGFFSELETKFGAPGEFAQAYVIAHEVGHHVQKLTGTLDRVHRERSRRSERQANELSVRLELQADYYAGVWAHHARRMAEITERDIRDGLRAAEAIGDDTLQKQAQGYVVPDSFTHGTSAQRIRWFSRGWQSGEMRDGNTFDLRASQL